MHTTITINGMDGMRFLSSVDHTLRFRMVVPPALEALMGAPEPTSIEVPAHEAEQIAAFVAELEAAGWITGISPPLLFSPRLGDEVVVVRDALLELQTGRRAPSTWCFIARGTRARLVARHAGKNRIVLHDGPYAREVAFASEKMMTRARPRPAM